MQGIRWNSKAAFVFATSAAAIGLGNIWRFTYVVGENGGGLFVLVYLLCVLGLGLPLILAEVVLGRLHRSHPVAITRVLADKSGRSSAWRLLGFMMLLSGFLILGYYVVIAGWVLRYFFSAISHGYHHLTPALVKSHFVVFTQNPYEVFAITLAVLVAAGVILALGIKQGLERAILFIFPLMFILIVALLIYAIVDTDFMQGVRYLFYPKVDAIKNLHDMFLSALGQAFFSLNIGMGVTCMFSAYLPKDISVVKAAIWVTIADTGFAILSGLIIFPFVIKFGLHYSEGPGLIFETLPLAFSKMAFGSWVGAIFFLMVFLAAFSSVIALVEPALCWLVETFSLRRGVAATVLMIVIAALSVGTIGSFSHPKLFSLQGFSFFNFLVY